MRRIALMKEAVTIKLTDLETSDEALVLIRYDESAVALGLSLRLNGDIEVVMTKDDARAIISALEAAVQ
jgi:hypothetical protein